MKLYSSVGPNPHVVTIFLKEKGLQLDSQTVDIRGGENRQEDYLSTVNGRGQTPVLKLDDGSHLSEITAICEYLEEKHPSPVLIGASAEQRAETRMWVRRIDLGICEPMGNGFRASEGYEMFKDRFRVLPDAADGLKAIAQDNLKWLDRELADQDTICKDRFSLADILLYSFLNFGARVGQPIDPELKNISAWFVRTSQRASIKSDV